MEQSLAQALSNSVRKEIADITGNLLEVGMDAIIDEGILKEIPVISLVVSCYNIGSSIRDRHNLLKLLAFVNQINQSLAKPEMIKKYQVAFETDEKKRNQELSYLLVIIDRYVGADRARILAKLYLAYLRNEICWEDLTSYAEAIERLMPTDYELLKKGGVTGIEYQEIPSGYLRLIAVGLMVDYGKSSAISLGKIVPMGGTSKNLALTQFGEKLTQILFS
jgi:hypothetical protein